MAAKSGESKQGLIVTLVFFVLATIILGVTTYMGFDGQEVLRTQAKDAAAKMKDAQTNRDYNRAQLLVWKAYGSSIPMSKEELEELPSLRRQLKEGQFKGEKTQDEALKQIEKVEKDLGWNDNKKQPEATYPRTVSDLTTKLGEKEKEFAKLDADSKDALAQFKKQLDNSAAEADALKKAVAAAEKKAVVDLDKYVKQIAQQQKDLDELGKARVDDQNKSEAARTGLLNQVAKLSKSVKDLENNLEKAREQLAPYVGVDLFEKDLPKGKIVNVDASGKQPFINLGSADNVKPELTFSVVGLGTGGRPSKDRKGTVEVTNVVGDHLSQVRVTSQVDANRNPILPGDLLFNPAWSPSLKQHVAIAGIIDLTGDTSSANPEAQMRALRDFMRILETQNMVVDAYLDLKDLKVKGEINRQTDYLILGETPDIAPSGAIKENDPKTERNTNIGKEMAELQKKALANAVTQISLRKFMAATGQKLPSRLEPTAEPTYLNRSVNSPLSKIQEKKEAVPEKK